MTINLDYQDISNVRAKVFWYGNSSQNTPDSLLLNDSGLNGDIINGDQMYSIKVKNDSTGLIKNVIGNDSGQVFIDYILTESGQTFIQPDSFEIDNLMLEHINSFPDSMLQPSQPNYYAIDSIL